MDNQTLKIGIQVAYRTVPSGEHEESVERLAMVAQIMDLDQNIAALSVYNPTGLMFLASVKKGDGEGEWNFITNK